MNNISWRQFGVSGYNKQLLADKALFGSVVKIVENRFVRFSHCSFIQGL